MAYPVGALIAGALAAYVVATATGGWLARIGFPLPPSPSRIGCIDGLRGYLAVSVLIHHVVIWIQISRLSGDWSPPTINALNQLGMGSVALFFMITGFVFYPRVLAGLRATDWTATYITRACRILPLIAVSILVATVVIGLRIDAVPGWDYPAAAATWLSSWGEPPLLGYPDSGRVNAYVLWSLYFEWLFYLFVLPVCALAMDAVRGRLPSWAVPLALLILALAVRKLRLPSQLPIHLPLFAIGMLAFEAQRVPWIAGLLRSRGSSVVAVAALGLGATSAPVPYGLIQLPLFGLFFACIASGNNLGGLLRTRGALVLGECSYGIYLLHGILLSVLFVDAASLIDSFDASRLAMAMPFAALAITLATSFTHLWIERPAIRAGKRIAGRWSNRRLRAGDPELEIAP